MKIWKFRAFNKQFIYQGDLSKQSHFFYQLKRKIDEHNNNKLDTNNNTIHINGINAH